VIGLTATFLVAGLAPPLMAVVAIVAARLPADELAHPLDVGAPAEPAAAPDLPRPAPPADDTVLDRV
jgi:hypothetical protein